VFTTVPSGRTFYYTVRRGDTLAAVASRYGVTTSELKSWNGLGRDSLSSGQKLRVTSDIVPAQKAGGRSKRVVATKGAGKQTASGSRHGTAHAAKAKSAAPVVARPAAAVPTARANGNPRG